jgi:iron uptake system component EfeO
VTLTDGIKTGTAALAAILAGVSMAGCTAKESATSSSSSEKASPEVTVDASDTACTLSSTEADTGPTTFVITNNGTKVTEFYVYGDGDRVLGEVENISPGLQRKLVVYLSEPGTYKTACKPGMVGDGIRADFVVKGASAQADETGKFKQASDEYNKYVDGQADELVTAATAFVAAIKAGDIASAKAQYPTTRTYYERIEPVAESFPDDLDPRIDLREADVEPGQQWTGFHRLEKDLWVSGLQPDTNAIADQLLADIKELDQKVKSPEYTIDSTQIAGGAQGLLDEVAASKITGEEDIFSHTDLWDFYANVEGSRTAVSSVRPILDERDGELGKRVDQRFESVEELLNKYRKGDGFVLYDSVTEPQRQELSRAIDALSKEVSQVQGVIAPQ